MVKIDGFEGSTQLKAGQGRINGNCGGDEVSSRFRADLHGDGFEFDKVVVLVIDGEAEPDGLTGR